MTRAAPFDPITALRELAHQGVRFVVIGGVAGRLHGSSSLTRDLDVCHERSPQNLAALSDVLTRANARLRGVDEDVPFLLDPRTLLAGGSFAFVTDHGDLDILAVPAGVAGFDELASRAVTVDLGDFEVQVASLDDLIRMKRAAGRPKDLIEVEILVALRDELGQS
jgi:predicted nucleotidyltransferase